MISNITPEDRELWDKRMQAHARRLNKPDKAKRITRFIIFLLIAAWLIYACCNAWRQVKPPGRTPEQVMGDTLRIGANDLPPYAEVRGDVIINAHTHFDENGSCLYDSLGRLIRTESGRCDSIEMVYDHGKWVPWSECSYCKTKKGDVNNRLKQ